MWESAVVAVNVRLGVLYGLLSAHLGLLSTINIVSHSQSLPALTCLPHFGHTASFAGTSLFSTNMTDIHVHTLS